MATVVFSVGIAHPLYKRPVIAIIDSKTCGYDGRRVYAHTVGKVHYEADPQGILVYDKDNRFVGYKTRPAYEEVWEGYVEEIISE